jgi:MFS family permease
VSSYLRVLRHPDFRYLFLGQSASNVGDQVVIVALALYVTQRTGSASDLGLVLAAQAVPLIALILFGGVWADRLPRQRIMLATDAARAVLHGVLAVLILTGGASVLQMVVIEALFGAARAFFNPAYTGLLPQTIPPEDAQEGRALSSVTANLAILVGPALGTGLVLWLGAGEAFAFDSATFVLSALLLARVRPAVALAEPAAPERATTVLHELRVGWREVASRPWVWATILGFTVAVLTAYSQWYSLAPTVARDAYGSTSTFGVLESVAGGGAVLGALLGIRWRPRRPMYVGLLLTLFWPLQSVSFAFASPLGAVVGLAFLAGFGFSLFEIWWETALVRHIPPEALSRVSAYDWMGSLALLPVGFAIAGPLASALGTRTVLGLGGGVAFATMALALVPRSTRTLIDERRSSGSSIDPSIDMNCPDRRAASCSDAENVPAARGAS